MTPISMHAASAPAFAKMLGNMLNWLEAAKAHAEAKKFSTDVYLTLRLAPDMLPLPRQIQIASDAAKGCVARLAGQEIPAYEDNEATLDELAERIKKTRDFVLSVPAEAFEGSEGREVSIPRRSGDPFKFDGSTYLRHFALPNFYFHATTTYALLRQAGVPLGKLDYLGG
ncbi:MULTISPECIES: DUF1993 family protein [unclassified Roseateles]|uniref:DUF1993 domain-containing protein n=1 Tax=unclassified Roseateles TaxID=2626991 RepID=UPI0006FF6672|nr:MULTISPECIES: DUF1993 domain-containing protein [unclassified Roseateles]KQW41119.1 hypothetical protein ASC81_22835 [Pelomonas sp. Root405]KRA67891.1 hypothetical protein ASD88_20820 [Pelomonas sp. Root662]